MLRDRIEALLLAMRVAKEVKAFKSFAGYLHAAGAGRSRSWASVVRAAAD